ncbi:MAG: SRPBCC family protein [Armatimonadota bacterium]|nr:SRPBCC family protein [Armatimonadota bacterium]MDR7449013.1 SRPBCC family protein [Armatimonadota bacterium]MDR7458607.1 SRPBCC family protein [Armatimonadota bacterium]MDR7479523.1 SRPBCC family protein [Armatimonadota bacterium]MDR7489077.1 SRPBCC family protein [Armatimonadota bacterium]
MRTSGGAGRLRRAAPRPVRVERERRIRAPQQRVYQLLSRVESLPRWFTDLWLVADILERESQQVTAELRGYFGGMPVESVQVIRLRPPARVEFRQVRGTFRHLEGEYAVTAEGAESVVRARVEVETGIPLLGETTARLVMGRALDRMLAKIKDAAERDLPRLVPARREAARARGEETPAEEEDAGRAPELPAGAEPVWAAEPAGAVPAAGGSTVQGSAVEGGVVEGSVVESAAVGGAEAQAGEAQGGEAVSREETPAVAGAVRVPRGRRRRRRRRRRPRPGWGQGGPTGGSPDGAPA